VRAAELWYRMAGEGAQVSRSGAHQGKFTADYLVRWPRGPVKIETNWRRNDDQMAPCGPVDPGRRYRPREREVREQVRRGLAGGAQRLRERDRSSRDDAAGADPRRLQGVERG